MSIIERALGKQRGPDTVGQQRTAPVALPSVPRDRTDSPADSPRGTQAPRASLSVTVEMLRADGLVPPEGASIRQHEQVRRIKWPLLESVVRPSARESGVSNLLMVTSAVAGEGKTYVSFNIALSIAREKDWSVLLVDGDVAKRHISAVLKCEERPGIVDAVMDEQVDPEDLVLDTGIPGLAFLPSGRKTNSAPELFSSNRMAQVVRALADGQRRRVVLFDTSPLLATNESAILARLVDQIILVVRAESTQQPAVLEAISLLDKATAIQCVLNQTRMSSLAEHYYGYNYYPHDRPKDL